MAKIRSLLPIVVVSIVLASCSSISREALELQGKQVPFTAFTLINGGYLVTDELQGRASVIAFWAHWCPHSRQSIIKLNDLARRYSHRTDIVFIAASLDSESDFKKLQNFIKEHELNNLIHAFSGHEAHDRAFLILKGERVPYIVVLDRATRVVSISHNEKEVDRLLAEGSR